MIEKVLTKGNLKQAFHKVRNNKGSAGVDKMTVLELHEHLTEHWHTYLQQITTENYQPQPILGVEIPKSNGKVRMLGIPTVVDRFLQQAVTQILTPLFEVEFEDFSYGFRPNRNAQQAVLKAQEYINSGYNHIVDIDLKSFFDEVDHCILLQLLFRKVKCKKLLKLIRKWLRAPMSIKGKLIKRRKGVPQGSPISPLLSNIMLNELDKVMDKMGLRYVRYADDFSIYCKSKAEARKIGNKVYLYLKDKLKLPINREKSGIRKPSQFKILGFGFTSTFTKGDKGKFQLIVLDKSWKSLYEKIKHVTRKTAPWTLKERIIDLNDIQRGWVQYFKIANISGKLKTMDGWVRNRLRYCIWKNWKKPERKRKNLIRLGVDPEHAYAYSRTRKGGWAIAQSPILTTTITLNRLRAKGYFAMLDYYTKIHSKS